MKLSVTSQSRMTLGGQRQKPSAQDPGGLCSRGEGGTTISGCKGEEKWVGGHPLLLCTFCSKHEMCCPLPAFSSLPWLQPVLLSSRICAGEVWHCILPALWVVPLCSCVFGGFSPLLPTFCSKEGSCQRGPSQLLWSP